MLRELGEEIRTAAGRNPKPSAGIIDSQTVKTAGPAVDVGYDGGKKIKRRKRHIVVDVLGLLLTVMVHSAGIQDRAGARLSKDYEFLPRTSEAFVKFAAIGMMMRRISPG